MSSRLDEFRELVKEVVRSACRTALLEAGFTPDDYFYEGTGDIAGALGGGFIFFLLLFDKFYFYSSLHLVLH